MSKNIEKMQKLEEELTPLIGKVVYCDGNLFKIKDFSLLKLSGEEYECDKKVVLDTDITFISCMTSKTYRHFTNEVVYKKFKMKNSDFRNYIIINDIENIENIYFIDDKRYENYNTSHFKNNKIQLIQNIDAFIYSMKNGPMREINNTFYFNARKECLRKQFNIYGFSRYKDEIKQLISKTDFIRYIKLYVEYKRHFLINLKDDSFLREKTEKLIQELQNEIIQLQNELSDESDSDSDDEE
jgi:hypothetical protein